MNEFDAYRGAKEVALLAQEIRKVSRTPATLMEICGGQTHAIMKHGLDQLLPPHIELLHGPGCPVCVTPAGVLDRAIWLCLEHGITLCSFGDMLRVPGTLGDLSSAKSRGGDVRVVYSPLDALEIAKRHPGLRVVFLAIGFETTAPANAMAVKMAKDAGVGNFFLLVSQVLVPPAMRALLESPGCKIRGFLAAGHVCTVTGTAEYRPIAEKYRVPIVVAGFEPVDILLGVLQCVRQIEVGKHEVENAYPRAVRDAGNPAALALVGEVFEVCDREWRGIGVLPASGWKLRPNYAAWDADECLPKMPEKNGDPASPSLRCRSGEVLQGKIKPSDCPFFGDACTPESPLGATMVSSEGACAAYYRYRR